MNIAIICVGKLKENFYKKAVDEYIKRLRSYVKIEIIEVDDEPEPAKSNDNIINILKETEAKKIKAKIKSDDFVVALCIYGKQRSSEDFAEMFLFHQNKGTKRIVFVIGGSNGISHSIIDKANDILSFSNMTFPHQLARVMLCEQIYRSQKINNNEKYHK